MPVTIVQVNSAIETTLATATGLTFTQDYDELTEGMADTPNLQVYFVEEITDPTSTSAQTTFGAGVRQVEWTFHADLYARQRSHIGEDMGALLPLVDAIRDTLEAQTGPTYFGQAGIKAIKQWTARQVVFRYGEPDLPYIGTRFIIKVRVF
jgi:hypothetical protein